MKRACLAVLALSVVAACGGGGEAAPDAAPPRPQSVEGQAAAAAPTTKFAFPIRPRRGVSYGRYHHDYPATDMFAPCGRPVVSPVDGVVAELSRVDRWDPATNLGSARGGKFVSVVTHDRMRFYGSHLRRVRAGLSRGDPVTRGQRLGRVGRTGNAASVACHLHFGISPNCGPGQWWIRRGVVRPWRFLQSWRSGENRSPRHAIAVWRAEHGCPD